MSYIKYALICADDDPIVLQMLGFQLEKIVDSKVTTCELAKPTIREIYLGGHATSTRDPANAAGVERTSRRPVI